MADLGLRGFKLWKSKIHQIVAVKQSSLGALYVLIVKETVAVACTQCKGNCVNSVDHLNGQFKAGGLCWLCRGKRDILCGDCNGAGFIGGS